MNESSLNKSLKVGDYVNRTTNPLDVGIVVNIEEGDGEFYIDCQEIKWAEGFSSVYMNTYFHKITEEEYIYGVLSNYK